MLYAVAAVVGILLGLAAAQVTYAGTRPRFPIWQSGLIGFGGAAVVLIASALFDEEFLPVTRQWLRHARRRRPDASRNRREV